MGRLDNDTPQEKEGVYTVELTIFPNAHITPYMLGFVVAYDPNNNNIKDQVGYAVFTVVPSASTLSRKLEDEQPSAALHSSSAAFFSTGTSHAQSEETTTITMSKTPTASSL